MNSFTSPAPLQNSEVPTSLPQDEFNLNDYFGTTETEAESDGIEVGQEDAL